MQPGEGHWGKWYPGNDEWDMCPISSFVSGFRLRMQEPQGGLGTGDDSALNSIELKCEDVHGCQKRLLHLHITNLHLFIKAFLSHSNNRNVP